MKLKEVKFWKLKLNKLLKYRTMSIELYILMVETGEIMLKKSKINK